MRGEPIGVPRGKWIGKHRAQPIAFLGSLADREKMDLFAQAIWVDAMLVPAALASAAKALGLNTENVAKMRRGITAARDMLRWLVENEDRLAMCVRHTELMERELERLERLNPDTFLGPKTRGQLYRLDGEKHEFATIRCFELIGEHERLLEFEFWGWKPDLEQMPRKLRDLASRCERQVIAMEAPPPSTTEAENE